MTFHSLFHVLPRTARGARARRRRRLHDYVVRGRILLVGAAVALVVFLIHAFTHSPIPPANAVAGTATFTGSSQTLTGDITAARIVDSANSSYFIDPAAAGTSISIAGNASISGTMTTASNQAFRPAFGPVKLDYKSGLDSWTTGLLIQDTTGNVGIGTSAPGQKLSVAGTVESTTGGFKFPDGTTQTSAATGMTSGMIAFFATACPSGWTEYTALRGRAVIGTPLSGTNAGTVGTALTNLQDPMHTHTGPSHQHNLGIGYSGGLTMNVYGYGSGGGLLMTNVTGFSGGDVSVATSLTSSSGTGATGGTSATMPYIQLTACQKD